MRLTLEEVIAAAETNDNIGFCVRCGTEHYCVEPDARKYQCEECGALAVYGAEEILISGLV